MYFERGIRMNAGKNIAKFRKEKELNQEGFEVIIQPISKKGQTNISENP